MFLTFGAPQALWLLLGVPLIWLAHLVTRTNFNPRQRFTQAAARSLLLTALALGLARPVISSTSSHQSIVYAVDVSHSVASHAIEAAAAKIDELNTALQPSHTRIVTFGKRAATTASTAALRQLAKSRTDAPAADGPDGSASDLEAALYAARGELAPEHVPRIVLFSDGHPTAGDVGSGVTHLAADRIPVSVEPLAPRTIADSWVDAVDLPAHIATGASQPVTVTVGSQRDGSGEITLKATALNLTGKPAARTGAAARHRGGPPRGDVSEGIDAGRARFHRRRAGRLRRRGPALRPRRSARGQQRAGQRGVGRSAAQGALRRRRAVERPLSRRRARRRRLRRDGPSGVGVSDHGRRPRAVRRRGRQRRPAKGHPRCRDDDTDRLGREGRRRAARGRRRGGVRRERLSQDADRTADAGHLRAQGRAGSRAGHRARSIVEHGRKLDGADQDGGTGRGRRPDRRAVDRHPHLQRQVRLGRDAAQRRQESRRHPQEDRGDRPWRTHVDLPGGRAGLLRAAQCQGPREARHPALGRPLVSRRVRGAGQEDDRGAHHGVDGCGRAIGRSGAAQEPRDVGQRPRLCRRRCGAGPGDLRQGSQECRPRPGSTRRRSRRS